MSLFSYLTLLDNPDTPVLDFQKRESVIDALRTQLDLARDREAEIVYILNHNSEFYLQDPDVPKLSEELNKLIKYKLLVRTQAQSCIQQMEKCKDIVPSLPAETTRPGRR